MMQSSHTITCCTTPAACPNASSCVVCVASCYTSAFPPYHNEPLQLLLLPSIPYSTRGCLESTVPVCLLYLLTAYVHTLMEMTKWPWFFRKWWQLRAKMRAWSGWATSANTTSTMPAEGGGGLGGDGGRGKRNKLS